MEIFKFFLEKQIASCIDEEKLYETYQGYNILILCRGMAIKLRENVKITRHLHLLLAILSALTHGWLPMF